MWNTQEMWGVSWGWSIYCAEAGQQGANGGQQGWRGDRGGLLEFSSI